MSGKILLSFDVEEFDLPREHGAEISLKKGIKVSVEGLRRILDILKRTEIKATFFCTGNFAKAQPTLLKQIINDGHEIACHGVDHFRPQKSDICESKKIIEGVVNFGVIGYRQPRMGKINYKKMKQYGYVYDSSINPALIPGRYNNLNIPRKAYIKEGIVEIPTSVATFMRVPLFWLALHIFPVKIYIRLAILSLKKTGYFATYFHPWEFADLDAFNMIPKYIKYNSGVKLVERLEKVIRKLKESNYVFETYDVYVKGLDKA